MAKQRIDRHDVIASATRVVDRRGNLADLALGKIAEDLGVRTSALYNHVDGVDGLRRALAAQSGEKLANLLRDAAVGRAGADALEELAHTYRRFAHDHPGQYASTLLAPSTPAPVAETPEPQAEIVRVIARILGAFSLEGDQAIHAARVVRSAIHGFVALEATESFVNPQDHDESFRMLVAFLIAGLDAGLLAQRHDIIVAEQDLGWSEEL
ncbi:MAG: TetR-like C-terminal domain-containing protein [Acidimicrobiales bacterium]